jgi:hypothetical protein
VSVVILNDCLDVLAFNYSSDRAVYVIGVIVNLVLFAALLWLNLYVAVGQTDRWRLLISGGVSVTVAALFLVYHFFSVREFSPLPEYVYFLKPPALQWVSPVDTETFLRDADAIFTTTSAQAAAP